MLPERSKAATVSSKSGAVVAPAIAVGTLFGRLGCFLNGCCFGDRCDLPWAVSFPAPSPPWEFQVKQQLIEANSLHSLPLHPTQLYSAIDALVLLLLLLAYYPLRRRDGEVLGVLMLAYPITRFLIEYLRNDEGVFFAGLTISQNISVLLFLGGLAYWAWLSRQPPWRSTNRPSCSSPWAACAPCRALLRRCVTGSAMPGTARAASATSRRCCWPV